MIIEAYDGVHIRVYEQYTNYETKYIDGGNDIVIENKDMMEYHCKYTRVLRKDITKNITLVDMSDGLINNTPNSIMVGSIHVTPYVTISFYNINIAKIYYMILVDFLEDRECPDVLNMMYIKEKYPEMLI